MTGEQRSEAQNEKRQFWKFQIEGWKASGITQKEYCRRKVDKVIKAKGSSKKQGGAEQAIAYIGRLYKIEKQARQLRLDTDGIVPAGNSLSLLGELYTEYQIHPFLFYPLSIQDGMSKISYSTDSSHNKKYQHLRTPDLNGQENGTAKRRP